MASHPPGCLSDSDRFDTTIAPGSRLGPYEILAPLGAGGMGEVYKARDPRLGREVAVKVLPASFSKDPDRLRRFEHEARAAGVLNHPNITAVYDIGSHDGAPYVVSELLEGETLRARLATGALSTRKALDEKDGRWLYVHSLGGVPLRIYRYEIGTGRRELWKEVSPADSAGLSAMSRFVPTSDGQSYAYSYFRVLSYLQVVDGLK